MHSNNSKHIWYEPISNDERVLMFMSDDSQSDDIDMSWEVVRDVA